MLLQTAIEAALRAGRLIAEQYPKRRNASYKGYRDLVTETDIAAEKTILDLVRRRFPDHAIFAEESTGGEIGPGYTWVIDPLDGTSNFAHRVPIFAVSVAVLEGGEPVIGVVHDPMRGHLFVAQRGRGATLNDQPLQVSDVSTLQEAMVGLDWGRTDEARREVISKVGRLAPRCHTMQVMGSATLGLTYVAAGWFDGYFYLDLNPWDAAAAVLLTTEAGGRCTTFEGQPYPVTSPRCAATNGRIHEELLDVLRGA